MSGMICQSPLDTGNKLSRETRDDNEIKRTKSMYRSSPERAAECAGIVCNFSNLRETLDCMSCIQTLPTAAHCSLSPAKLGLFEFALYQLAICSDSAAVSQLRWFIR